MHVARARHGAVNRPRPVAPGFSQEITPLRGTFGTRSRFSGRQRRVPDAALTFAASMRLTRRSRAPQRYFLCGIRSKTAKGLMRVALIPFSVSFGLSPRTTIDATEPPLTRLPPAECCVQSPHDAYRLAATRAASLSRRRWLPDNVAPHRH